MPGFEPLKENNAQKAVLKYVIRTRLTQFLCKPESCYAVAFDSN